MKDLQRIRRLPSEWDKVDLLHPFHPSHKVGRQEIRTTRVIFGRAIFGSDFLFQILWKME